MGMLNLPIVRPRRVVFNPRDYPHISDLPQFRIRDINELISRCFKLPRRLGDRSESQVRSELEDYFSRLLGVRDVGRLIELKVDANDPALQLALKHAYRANRRPSEFDEVRRFISDVIEPRRNSIYVGNCNRPSAFGTFILLGNVVYGMIVSPSGTSSGPYSDDNFTWGAGTNTINKCSNNQYCGSAYYGLGITTSSYNNGSSITTFLGATNYYPISQPDVSQVWGIQYAPYVNSTNPLTLIMYGSWTASGSWTRNYIVIGPGSVELYGCCNCKLPDVIPVFYAYSSSGFSVSNNVSYVSEWEIIYS